MAFKICTFCRHEWETRDDFLADDTLKLCGYQVNYGDLVAGLFIFTHEVHGCMTSIAIEAEKFVDLHEGEMFEECMHGTDLCEGRCDVEMDIEPCQNKCECSYVRSVLNVVNTWPKATEEQTA